jgi:hypothetical protein
MGSVEPRAQSESGPAARFILNGYVGLEPGQRFVNVDSS